jgi:multidrug efflux pump
MASSVAAPLERALGTIAGVGEISSRSSQGSTRISVQFDLAKDINVAAREVQAAINASRSLLPSGLPGMPSYRKINPSQAPIMILALSDTRTAARSTTWPRRAGAEGRRSPIGDVAVSGGAARGRADSSRAQSVRHRARGRAAGVASASQLRPGIVGWAAAPGRSRRHRSRASDYEPLIIAYRNSAPVRLADAAAVSDGEGPPTRA